MFIIVADCGGGDDLNPHKTLESAKNRVTGETGIEIWEIPDDCDYKKVDVTEIGTLVYEA